MNESTRKALEAISWKPGTAFKMFGDVSGVGARVGGLKRRGLIEDVGSAASGSTLWDLTDQGRAALREAGKTGKDE